MSRTLTLARRELAGLLYSPIAYVVLAIAALGSGLIFLISFAPGNAASMRNPYDGMVWLLVFLAPAISMRLLSEEYSRGSIEKLLTSPVSDVQVVVGKWLAAVAFFALLLLPLVVQAGVLAWFAGPDWGPVVAGGVGLLLVGALYLAIGMAASAATENQIIAFLLAVLGIAAFTFLLYFAPELTSLPTGVRQAMVYANVNRQFNEFSRGLMDVRNLVYFASVTAWFLFLAVKLLESRRWR